MNTFNLKEAAAFLKTTPQALKKLVIDQKVPAARNGNDWIFIDVDLLAHIRNQYTSQAPIGDLEVSQLNRPHMPTFEELVPLVLRIEESRLRRGDLSNKALQITKYRLKKYVLGFFGKRLICEIDYVLIESFVSKLSELDLQGVAINQYLVIVRKVLNYAQMTNVITSVPTFPKVKEPRSPRGGFTINEYRTLIQSAWHLRNKPYEMATRGKEMRVQGAWGVEVIMPKEMTRLIRFMVNSFIRPSDLKFIQHKHVEIIQGKHQYLRLTLPETKKHDCPIVTMPAAVAIYKRLVMDAKALGLGQPNDYVFMPELKTRRDYALRHFGFLFNWVLKESNLKSGSRGQNRSLYSLRHTAITFRLLYGQGVDVLTLAKNARTSVNMVEKFYASTLNGELNISLLHSKRTKHQNLRQ